MPVSPDPPVQFSDELQRLSWEAGWKAGRRDVIASMRQALHGFAPVAEKAGEEASLVSLVDRIMYLRDESVRRRNQSLRRADALHVANQERKRYRLEAEALKKERDALPSSLLAHRFNNITR